MKEDFKHISNGENSAALIALTPKGSNIREHDATLGNLNKSLFINIFS
jgi:hypothetical protein